MLVRQTFAAWAYLWYVVGNLNRAKAGLMVHCSVGNGVDL